MYYLASPGLRLLSAAFTLAGLFRAFSAGNRFIAPNALTRTFDCTRIFMTANINKAYNKFCQCD